MPKPLAICIEDLNAPSKASKYLQCVALPGRQPGLRLDETGRVIWFSEKAVACELWVSADDRLILYRPDDASPVQVRRAGRSLNVPLNKPVILLDKDEVNVGARHLRIHIHGEVAAVAAPTPLVMKPRPFDRLAQTAAAAAVISTLATGCIEVRETPPVVASPTDTPTPTIEVRDFPPEPVIPSDTPTPTIEVRDFPPEPVIPSDTPTPTIEVRDFPPTATAPPVTPVVEGSVAWVLQSPWAVTQTYMVNGHTVQFNGTLTLAGSSYTFIESVEGMRPEEDGTLNFLFDNSWGGIGIVYAEGVTPASLLTEFAPGDVLATCTFYAASTIGGEFQIVVGESGNLYFAPLSSTGASGDWQITQALPD
ncbi:MAG: hypothetical protein JXR84_13020 [Anaerolineae bacterium]|nr:hypothetical protein [Anaerolineae bacterium]